MTRAIFAQTFDVNPVPREAELARGGNHPDTAASLYNATSVQTTTGEDEPAARYHDRAVATFERKPRPDAFEDTGGTGGLATGSYLVGQQAREGAGSGEAGWRRDAVRPAGI